MNKVKAFTLTELLVVVIVIGVLAAIVLPKFSRVIETRRTTEAEEILAAVRAEQEKRCILGKNYTGSFEKIPTVAFLQSEASQGKTGNYSYALTSTGVEAARLGQEYILKIPSYQTGQLCCEGDYCDKLNKNYPLCSEISIPAKDECAAENIIPAEPPDPCEENPNSCSCSAYAAENPCICDASYAANNPCICDPNGAACEPPSPCDQEATKNTCECDSYARSHLCECSPSVGNCCSYFDDPYKMDFNPQTGECSCPAGSVMKDYGDYAACICSAGSETSSQYCCEDRGYNWEGGACKSLCMSVKFKASYVSYGGNNSNRGSLGFYTMGGNYTCEEYPSSSGGGQDWARLSSSYSVCTDDGSFSGYPVSPESAGLTCENYAGSKTSDFSCAYRLTYYGSSYNDCAMGVMTCKKESMKTWYCPIGKCTQKENQCL